MNRILAFILPILVCASVPVCHASSQDSISRALDEVTITAIHSERRLVTGQTIQGSDLQALSSTSIADALKYFAGVQIKDYGGLGGLKTINVRSLGAQHTGVFIDGVRLTNAQNGTVDLGKYSLSTLESISLYNANRLNACQSASEYASGATVYMQTRRPENDSLTVQVKGASFHTYTGKFNIQKACNKWQGFVDAEYTDSKGDYPFRYKSRYEDTIGVRANSDIEYLRVEGAMFSGDFQSHIYYYTSERGCPGGVVRRLSDKYDNVGREWDRDFFVQGTWDHAFSSMHRLKATAKHTREYLRYCTDYPENQNTARVDNHYRQNDSYVALSYCLSPASWLSLNTGADARWSDLTSDLKFFDRVSRFDGKAVIAGLAEWRGVSAAASYLCQYYKDDTKISVGAADPLFKATPSVSLSYTVHGFTVRAWYKQIFRAPTLNDLYYTQAGNRNLKPEFTRQWNLGLEYHAAPGRWVLSAQADAYRNDITDRIVCLPMKGTYTWSMLNYGKTLCHGLNGSTTMQYRSGKWMAGVTASCTIQDDRNRTGSADDDSWNMIICYSPKFSSGVTAMGAWRFLTLSVSELHVSERMWSYADPEDILKPYDNIDMKLSADFPHWGVCFEVNDLLDVQYELIQRYPMPGRNFKLSLTLKL
ncbi:MAG: TonB-dependent receptor [Bacteroidaceae bacterium]|nr:TonB-dependent receptor [Bacteroidaceae bacterium]